MTTKTSQNRAPYLIEVVNLYDTTPHLRRITFKAPDLHYYPAKTAAAHIKIFLPREGQIQPDLPILSENGPIWAPDAVRPFIRTYSIRAIRPELGEIDIEFALHDHNGPAVEFARKAKPGDRIGISNPGGPKPMLPEANFYCLAGDPSSLPAIAALLENLPAYSKGQAFIRVDAQSDVFNLQRPIGFELNWIIGSTEKTKELITQFCSLQPSQNGTFFWLAGEDRLVVELRRYLRRELHCERNQLYAVPYWREGVNEEGYHDKRHEIMDNIDS